MSCGVKTRQQKLRVASLGMLRITHHRSPTGTKEKWAPGRHPTPSHGMEEVGGKTHIALVFGGGTAGVCSLVPVGLRNADGCPILAGCRTTLSGASRGL